MNFLCVIFIFCIISSSMRSHNCTNGLTPSTTEIGSSSQTQFRNCITELFTTKKSTRWTSFNDFEEFVQVAMENDYMKKLCVEKFPGQFYLFPYKKTNEQKPPYDINVLPVWMEDENYGTGIKVMIISDGLDTQHPDLKDNYDSNYGYDFVDDDAMPHSDSPDAAQGTKAAGLIAMNLNDASCGIGISPEVVLGAIRLIGPQNTVRPENFVQALRYKITEIDIILLTWQQMHEQTDTLPLQEEIYQAYENSVTQGRLGKGVIHVVPAGNKEDKTDLSACATNLNVNNIYTIAVGASNHDGSVNEHTAFCSAVMVTAYSKSVNPEQASTSTDTIKLSTTDVNGQCTVDYGGTEAAASIVVGVIAQVLHTNPNLTWRDVQHLIAWTSEVAPVQNNRNNYVPWKKNKSRFYISAYFGFGMINAHRLIQMAKNFKSVPPMRMCESFSEINDALEKPTFAAVPVKHFSIYVGKECKVNYIEHIQLKVTLRNTTKGNTIIRAESPSGTFMQLASIKLANFQNEIRDWVFDSVMTWGESPEGRWLFFISNSGENHRQTGQLITLTLRIYGTKHAPAHYKKVNLVVRGPLRDSVPQKYWRTYRSYMQPVPIVM